MFNLTDHYDNNVTEVLHHLRNTKSLKSSSTERKQKIQAMEEAIQLNQVYFDAGAKGGDVAVETVKGDGIPNPRVLPKPPSRRKPWSLMIDLETLGRLPDSVIIEIAVQQFDLQSGALGKSLYLQVDKESCLEYGLKIEPETKQWWAEQEVHYSERIKEPMPLPMALRLLKTFIKNSIGKESTVWSKGTDFDIAILRTAYDKVGIPFPYEYYMTRDVRTIMKLRPELNVKTERGTVHDPKADCRFQINCLLKTLRSIGL
jgi:hypothetical protein